METEVPIKKPKPPFWGTARFFGVNLWIWALVLAFLVAFITIETGTGVKLEGPLIIVTFIIWTCEFYIILRIIHWIIKKFRK
jgi:hypothetical protein